MTNFITEETMKYRVLELQEVAARCRSVPKPEEPELEPEMEPEKRWPKKVLFRGDWMRLDDIARLAANF